MRFHRVPWEEIGAALSLACLTLLSIDADEIASTTSPVPHWAYLHRGALYIALSATAFSLHVVRAFRRDTRKSKIRGFLKCLHERYFSVGPGMPDPECRVTLFVPRTRPRLSFRRPVFRRHVLKFCVRSMELHSTSRTTWDIDKSKRGQFDGIAGYAFATGVFVQKDDLPDYDGGNQQDRDRYLQETFTTKKRVEKLSWRARSFRALVVKDRAGNDIALLMMESKNPRGLAVIDSMKLYWEARLLQSLLV
jgi:hypothetical protein